MDLFSPLTLGALELRNCIIMAPMTRSRADSNAVPTPIMVEHYRQRASAGMIISEGIAPSADGIGYCRTPGLYNAAQVAAWKRYWMQYMPRVGLWLRSLCMWVASPTSSINPQAVRR